MKKALVIGNGESRAWFKPCHQTIIEKDVMTWGCNAIYRDGHVHNLIAMDYAMQQEIYNSGYCDNNPEYGDVHNVYFANWNILPATAVDMMLIGFDIPEAFIHKSKNRTNHCVIQGKDPNTIQEKIEYTMQMYPNLDMNDLKLKMEKDVGIWITYVNEDDNIINMGSPTLSAGNVAVLMACNEQRAKEVYLLGFDLSKYGDALNNIYKGTDNYLPTNAKGFNPINWITQLTEIFDKYKSTTFYWTDCKIGGNASWHGASLTDYHSNVEIISKSKLCEELVIV